MLAIYDIASHGNKFGVVTACMTQLFTWTVRSEIHRHDDFYLILIICSNHSINDQRFILTTTKKLWQIIITGNSSPASHMVLLEVLKMWL
jgi:hypothetical protein